MKPTEEQVKKFWEWCGLKWFWNHNPKCQCGAIDNDDDERSWEDQDKNGEWHLASNFWHERMDDVSRPEFLGYLFKYAVPKLQKEGIIVTIIAFEESGYGVHLCSIFHEEPHFEVRGEVLANVLFEAIYKLIEEILNEKSNGTRSGK